MGNGYTPIYTEKKRKTLINRERKRLLEIFENVESKHKQTVEKLIDEAAFMTATSMSIKTAKISSVLRRVRRSKFTTKCSTLTRKSSSSYVTFWARFRKALGNQIRERNWSSS